MESETVLPLTCNLVLDGLSDELRKPLLVQARYRTFAAQTALFAFGDRPRSLVFLTEGLACEYIEFSNGTKAEIGMIGREGLPGFQTLLRNATATSSCRMQTAGAGIQVPLDQLKALFAESTEFRDQIHRLAQNQLAITAQVAACNAHHQTEARLARWILMAWERLGQSRLNATQAQLAEMLGVRRSTIALIAATLQRGGSIAYTRGNIAVKNRAVLEEIACECYGICRDAMEALYKNEPAPGSNSATDRQPLGLSPVIAS